MKNLFSLFLSALILFSTTQCADQLDLEPIAQESSVTAFDTPSKMESALIGAYDVFGGGNEASANEYYAWDYLNFQDMRADNAYAGGDGADLFAVDLLQIEPLNPRLEWHWRSLYSAIGRANNVIEKAPLVEDEAYQAGRMNEIIGEALFLRAYHYYHLVTMWSGVPMVLETAKSIDVNDLSVPRATSEAVYAQILADLDLAISYLPDTYGTNPETRIRATSGAANALAAKASLQKPTPDPQAALNYLTALENSGANYQLLDNYDHLFDGEHEYNAESILEVPYIDAIAGSIRPQLLLPPSRTNDGWRKFITPSHDLIDLFQAEGDNVRLSSSVLFESVGWIDEYWGNAENSTIPFVFKWRTAGGWASENNNMLLRYADMILLKAEALNNLGRTGEAAAEVNRVRSRVSLPDLTVAETASQEAMQQAILKERRLELAFEGERWNDLVRNGAVISTMNSLNEIDLRTGNAVNYNMTDDKIIVPIPQVEVDLNPNLIQGRM